MLNQLSLFDVNWTQSIRSGQAGQTLTKECRRCGEHKALEEFPYFSTSTAGRKNTCKTCSNDLRIVRDRLRKQNPTPAPGNCPACGRHTESWVLDHCHHSNAFRGYVCDSCNLGFGKFNDDPALMMAAIHYLINSTQPSETTKVIS
jgi:hypothetical protein